MSKKRGYIEYQNIIFIHKNFSSHQTILYDKYADGGPSARHGMAEAKNSFRSKLQVNYKRVKNPNSDEFYRSSHCIIPYGNWFDSKVYIVSLHFADCFKFTSGQCCSTRDLKKRKTSFRHF